MNAGTLITELKRRRVFRMLVGYGIVAFAVLQVVEPVMHALHLPDVTLTYVVLALAIGFPVAVVLAWAFDVNEGRIERAAPAAAPALTGTRLRLLLLCMGLVAAAPGVIWYFVWPATARHSRSIASASMTPSIAVLPFVDMSPGKDQEYFSDGIAEEILNALAQTTSLRVAGRTSSFSFRRKEDDLREIGQKLSVTHVLEGSVRREGDRVRITAQLINVADGFHVWSQNFDREIKGILVLQDEIAREVVGALKIRLLSTKSAGAQERRSTDPEAYNLYLLANRSQELYSPDSVRRSISLYQKALALDPRLAPAWSMLATAYWWSAVNAPPAQAIELSRLGVEAADKAIELNPDLGSAYGTRAVIRWQQWDWAGATADQSRAMALSPREPAVLGFQCILERLSGRLSSSAAACRQRIEVDPLGVAGWNLITFTHLASGEYALARAAVARASELSPDSSAARFNRCSVAFFSGDQAAALELCAQLTDPDDRLYWTALARFELGDAAAADRALQTLVERMGKNDPEQIGDFYAWLGENDRAFEWLERAYTRHRGLTEIKTEPLLRKIRGDPRWTALLKKMNLPLD